MVIPCSFPNDAKEQQFAGITADTVSGGHVNGSTVNFVVGPTDDAWTISAHYAVLAQKCPTLAALVTCQHGHTTVHIPDVDKRGFEHLIKYLDGSDIKFTSVQTARTTLDVACRFQCVSLTKACIAFIDWKLTPSNVLSVYKKLSVHCNNAHTLEPCAPAFDAVSLDENSSQIQEFCSALLHNCLLVIDSNAEEVLTNEEFDDLNFKDMSVIVSRNTLQLKSEKVLFDGLIRWYNCECMRRNCPRSSVTRREILGDLAYKVRYGLMTKEEFVKGPGSSNVFDESEKNQIRAALDNPKDFDLKGPLEDTKKRRVKGIVNPIYLSDRSKPECGSKKSKVKKEKDKDKSPSSGVLTCLAIFTAIFD